MDTFWAMKHMPHARKNISPFLKPHGLQAKMVKFAWKVYIFETKWKVKPQKILRVLWSCVSGWKCFLWVTVDTFWPMKHMPHARKKFSAHFWTHMGCFKPKYSGLLEKAIFFQKWIFLQSKAQKEFCAYFYHVYRVGNAFKRSLWILSDPWTHATR